MKELLKGYWTKTQRNESVAGQISNIKVVQGENFRAEQLRVK